MTALSIADVSLRRVRDLCVIDVGPDLAFVVACDAVGGIGPKDADTYRTDAGSTAHFATRVPLLELLSAGARPLLVVDNLCVEAEPTGAEMLAAVRELLRQVDPLHDVAVIGSTEDNVPTRSTAVGITVIGVASPEGLRAGSSQAGDAVVCLGLPLSAPTHDLYQGHPQIVALDDMRTALEIDGVHDALPVGSRGVAAEARDLAASAGLEIDLARSPEVDLTHSAGPSSCVLVSCGMPAIAELRRVRDDLPVNVVGGLRQPRAIDR